MSDAPAWALGYDVAELKSVAATFKARYGHLIFGAFGLPKERDIALAMKQGTFFDLEDGGLAIARRLKATATHRDFTGRAIKLPAGDWIVSDFCPGPRAETSLIWLTQALQHHTGSDPCVASCTIWIEVFVEDRVVTDALQARGFAKICTKIAAGSEIKGLYLHCPEEYLEARLPKKLPAEEYLTLHKMESAFFDAAELGEVEGEILGWELNAPKKSAAWAQHYSSYNKRGSWTAFCLRGYADDPLFVMKPEEMSKGWKAENPECLTAEPRWTLAAEAFPKTLEMIEQRLRYAYQRVRFMRLAPGTGELSRHADITDRDAGIADGKIARLHIPIRTHQQVRFGAWDAGGTKLDVNMAAGDLWYLDQRKPHTVRNLSPVDRVHLVVDCVASPELRLRLWPK